MKKGELTKQSIIEVTAGLLHEKGYFATSLKDIVEGGGIPKGSVYYHFPEGKDEIIDKAVEHLSDKVLEYLISLVPSKNLFDQIIDFFIEQILKSDFKQSCPISTVALETMDIERVNNSCRWSYEKWVSAIYEKTEKSFKNISKEDVWQYFCLIEGAIMATVTMKDIAIMERSKLTIRNLLSLAGN